MDKVEVKLCVVTTLTRRGLGTEGSPIRAITEVWDKKTGEKIAEQDPFVTFPDTVRRSREDLTSPCSGVV